jgi:hypothetical protein
MNNCVPQISRTDDPDVELIGADLERAFSQLQIGWARAVSLGFEARFGGLLLVCSMSAYGRFRRLWPPDLPLD